MKAKLKYASGWVLEFPATDFSANLFLEALANYQHEHRKNKYSLEFRISKQCKDVSDIDSDVFIIRFNNILREDAQNFKDYINSNR